MGISGYNIGQANPRLRFLLLIFAATITFGILIWWGQIYRDSQDYVDFSDPARQRRHEQITSTSAYTDELRKELQNGQNQGSY